MRDKQVLTGQVIKGVGGYYNVLSGGRVIKCNIRGKIKLDDIVCIGDYVEFVDFANGRGAIEKILPRKNKITRPYITNIDMIVICIAPLPRPDFYLVDKLLINCLKQNITPVLCVNKIDIIDDEFKKSVQVSYEGLCDICYVSAMTGEGIDKLTELMTNKYVSMAGQSAVGKSSIINSIVGTNFLQTGELSQKVERGRHTTRQVEIFDIGHGIRLADTCGFSVMSIDGIDPSQLSTYFTDFDKYAAQCKYSGCNHINEPDCAVKKAVEEGTLSKQRYDRYVALYNDLAQKWRKRYD